jgi:hypothetical protein
MYYVPPLPSPSTAITKEAFHAAFLVGDLDTIAAYVAQPSGRQEIDEVEAHIVRFAPQKATFYLRGDGHGLPWFFRRKVRAFSPENEHILPVVAARFGHAHIIQWFFSRERAAFMGATLRLLLHAVLLYDEARMVHTRVWTSDPHILEILIGSHTFQHGHDEPSRQALLDAVAMYTRNPALVTIAISHGACIHQPETLAAVAWHDRTGIVDLLVAEGALLVGADVLHHAAWGCNVHSTKLLLQYGADWGNATTWPLIVSANQMWHQCDVVGASLAMEKGFFDVDAQNAAGETALMLAARFEDQWRRDTFPDLSAHVARSLLDYGASTELQNRDGRTAMWFARRKRNDAVAAVLLAAGASDDPRWLGNEFTHQGDAEE